MNTFETPRLRLRMFREDDFDSYAEMMADPEVMRYLPQGGPLPRPEAWRNMAAVLGQSKNRPAASLSGASGPFARPDGRAWN